MISVKATREGLPGKTTSSGFIIDTAVSFVALPSTRALHRFVHLRNPANGNTAIAQVLDVGPWNEHDDAYVFNGSRPASEHGEHVVYVNGVPQQKIEPEKVTGAGIDLGQRVWNDLGMTGNGQVEWEFLLL